MMIQMTFSSQLGIRLPIICGAMYPCSNTKLVASVSEAGGIGVIQPLSLVYVYNKEFRAGVREIRTLTKNPIGLNVIVEKSTKIYEKRMRQWLDIALTEGVRFFVTALGNPSWVVKLVKSASAGAVIYHDVTERKWALKAMDAGVDGLICVNNQAGGHAGKLGPAELFEELKDLKVPLICAGGVGNESQFCRALQLGYAGVQMGTRFIATDECEAHSTYKQAIVGSEEKDIVLTTRVSGVPLAVIETPYLKAVGKDVGIIGKWLLRNPKTKHWARLFYSLKSVYTLKRSSLRGIKGGGEGGAKGSTKDFWQAGKSVSGIQSIESVPQIMGRFEAALKNQFPPTGGSGQSGALSGG